MSNDTDQSWLRFIRLCKGAPSDDLLEELFETFFTKEEKRCIQARYCIIRALLENNLSQREIAKTFQTSIAQITRGSHAMKGISQELRQFLLSFMDSTQ